jgi:GT2 family glycosyltransferase
MNVAVVILNYNGQSYLEQFLPAVVEHSEGAEIYVVDNASTDDSVHFLKTHYPDIKLVVNTSNGGFAKGYNDGLKSICADIYVLLNSDVEVTEGWLSAPVELLKKQEEIAAIQPKILAFHDKTRFEHAGAAGGFLDQNYFPFCRGRIFQEVEEDLGQYNDEKEVFWASGACLFIRANDFHQMNGFDADFFAHMEEIDLCWRLKKQNRQIYYSGKSVVYHVGGGTLNYDTPKKTYLNFRNSLFMIIKNHHGMLFPKLVWRMCLDGLAGAVFIAKFQFAHFAAVFKAHMSVYARLRTFLKKRKALKTSTKPTLTGLYKGNITFRKFLGGVNKYSQLKQDKFL